MSGLCLYLLLSTFNFTDASKFDSELSMIQYQSRKNNSISDNHLYSPTINVPNNRNSKELIEIVLTAEEIEHADTEHNIGISDPYNTKYITQEEVVESIKRILGKKYEFDTIEPEFKEKFITLRHTEMIRNIPESKSTVLSAVNEYVTKIRKQNEIIEDNNNTNLILQAEQSIQETNSILNR